MEQIIRPKERKPNQALTALNASHLTLFLFFWQKSTRFGFVAVKLVMLQETKKQSGMISKLEADQTLIRLSFIHKDTNKHR